MTKMKYLFALILGCLSFSCNKLETYETSVLPIKSDILSRYNRYCTNIYYICTIQNTFNNLDYSKFTLSTQETNTIINSFSNRIKFADNSGTLWGIIDGHEVIINDTPPYNIISILTQFNKKLINKHTKIETKNSPIWEVIYYNKNKILLIDSLNNQPTSLYPSPP